MRVYFIGIGGIGMSGVAGLAKAAGFSVSGSDKLPLYPPAGDLLQSLNIPVIPPQEENILRSSPDLVVVGNAIKRDHPEVKACLENKIPLYSFPQFLSTHLFPHQRTLVVSGTHGKTTTSAFLGEALVNLGEDPTYLVGGILRSTGLNFRLGMGQWAVIEGDEYPTAFFDSSPKFYHYKPFGLIVTSLEYDHADVYPDLDSLIKVFSHLVSQVPPEGVIVLNWDSDILRDLAKYARGRVIFYGKKEGATVRLLNCKTILKGQRFSTKITFEMAGRKVEIGEGGNIELPGEHNALNFLSLYALLHELGFSPEKLNKALASFAGVKRRQEVLLARDQLVVIDDFAHHPTAVRETLLSLKSILNPNQTILIFEPRTNTSKRKVFQREYEDVLSLAEIILIKEPPLLSVIPLEERLDLKGLIRVLREKGRRAYLMQEKKPIEFITGEKNLILFMSSASMWEEIHNLLRELKGL